MPLHSIHLALTHHCTQRCIMCERWNWMEAKENKSCKELEEKEIEILVHDLKNLGINSITLTGGEPTIREDLCRIISLILSQEFHCHLVTNGTLLAKKLDTLLLVEGIKSKNFGVAVSFLGADAQIHDKNTRLCGSFDKALELLKFLYQKGIHREIFYTILPGNFHQIENILDFACEYEVGYVRYGFLHGFTDVHFTQKDIEEIQPYLEKILKIRKRLDKKYPGKKVPKVFLEKLLFDRLLNGEIAPEDLERGTLASSILKKGPIFCEYCNTTSFIDPFGNVYPCYYSNFSNQNFAEYSTLRNKYNMGNIRQMPFSKIWAGEKYQNFLKRISPIQPADKELQEEVCSQCIYCFGFAAKQAKKENK